MCIHTYIHVYIHTCTYIHTYMHVHTYIHTYIHTYDSFVDSFCFGIANAIGFRKNVRQLSSSVILLLSYNMQYKFSWKKT